jgi:spore coat polysaccharide biosynthesis protein SpsF
MKIVIIVQARMGSSRLPGKVLLNLAGEPMLVRVVNRLLRTQADEVVIATTLNSADDQIEELCTQRGFACFRGSENDVLDRYYQAARRHGADIVVRVTSDCPVVDSGLTTRLIQEFCDRLPDIDCASTVLPVRTYPRGLDAEAFSFRVLEKLWREDHSPVGREHVTPFIHSHLDQFCVHGITHTMDCSYMRWTVDTPEDFDLVGRIYGAFQHDRFSWREVLALLEKHPDWLEINSHIEQKVMA